MGNIDNLKGALENVSDSYPDFVIGGLRLARKYPNYIDKILSFIQSNPTANTSEIIKFETEEILGIKPIIPDEPPE